MKTKETTFGELNQGDRFALSPGHFDPETGDDYINMKVAPAVLCERTPLGAEHIPFNVVRLRDGSVRTFRDERVVIVLED